MHQWAGHQSVLQPPKPPSHPPPNKRARNHVSAQQKRAHQPLASPAFWPLAWWPSPAVKPSLAKAGMEKCAGIARRAPELIAGTSKHKLRRQATVWVIPKRWGSPTVPATKIVGGSSRLRTEQPHPIKGPAQAFDTFHHESQGWARLRSCLFPHPQGNAARGLWFERLSDNYLGGGLTGFHHLTLIRQTVINHPAHGVVGFRLFSDPLKLGLSAIVESPGPRIEPVYVSGPSGLGFEAATISTIWLRCPTNEPCVELRADRIPTVQEFLEANPDRKNLFALTCSFQARLQRNGSFSPRTGSAGRCDLVT